MRFNKAELFTIAQEASHNFNKEGILSIVQKQEGIFKNNEVIVQRWCRLRGNLLFYFKSVDHYSEPLGLLVLENFHIVEDDQKNIPFSFIIATDSGNTIFAAISQLEKQSWIEVMQRSSISNVKQEISNIIRKIKSLGQTFPVNIDTIRSNTGTEIDLNKPPFLELLIACDNLRCDGSGTPPSPRVSVFVLNPPDDQWILYKQTETLQRTSNPAFLSTISFRESDGIDAKTKLCLVVYDVRDRVSDTAMQIGRTMMSIKSITNISKTRLFLLSPEKHTVGFITVSTWNLTTESDFKNQLNLATPKHLGSSKPSTSRHRRTRSLPPVLKREAIITTNENLSSMYANPSISTYRFHSGLGGDISVTEIMSEPYLAVRLPQKILKLWIKEEQVVQEEIAALGILRDQWHDRQTDLLARHAMLISSYEVALDAMETRSRSGVWFRKSIEKTESSLAFVPLNLHNQRVCVRNDALRKCESYDIFTVGAFSANSLGYGKESISSLSANLEKSSRKSKCEDKTSTCMKAVQNLRTIRQEIIDMLRTLVAALQKNNFELLSRTVKELQLKTQMLLHVMDFSLVTEALDFLEQIRLPINPKNITIASSRHSFSEIDKYLLPEKALELELPSPSGEESLPGEEPAAEEGAAEGKDTSEVSSQTSNPTRMKIEESLADYELNRGYKLTDEPEPWDLIHLNIKASLISMSSKFKIFLDRNYRGSALSLPKIRSSSAFQQITKDSTISVSSTEKIPRDCAQTLFSSCFLTPDVSPSEDDSGIVLDKEELTNATDIDSRTTDGKRDRQRNQVITGSSLGACCIPKVSPVFNDSNSAYNESIHEEYEDPASVVDQEGVDWLKEISPSIRKLRQAIDALLRSSRLTLSLFRLQDAPSKSEMLQTLKYRRNICFCQALTSLVTGLMTHIWCKKTDPVFTALLLQTGPLVQFEGLLSFLGVESERMEDMSAAILDLSKVEFVLVPAGILNDDSSSKVIPTPCVAGTRSNFRVVLPVPEHFMSSLSSEGSNLAAESASFRIHPVFFNVGINEEASLAAKLGRDKDQFKLNQENFEKLKKYYGHFKKLYPEPDFRRNTLSGPTNSRKGMTLAEMMTSLQIEVASKHSKNVAILQLAAKICRKMAGLRFTSCKSAKDRTGMSATLEQLNIFMEDFDLSESESKSALDCMRMQGTRRENCRKNIYVDKYSFSSIQLALFPADYKPPIGTFTAGKT